MNRRDGSQPEGSTAPGAGICRVRVLGGLLLEGATGASLGRRPLAVLARLVSEHPSPVGRERLAAFLWPDHSPRRARHRLSDALYLLRGALGEGAILAAGDDLRLDPARMTSDLWDFDGALRSGRLEEAVHQYGGPFLEGFSAGGDGEFERWADLEGSRIRRRFRDALESLARQAETAGDAREAARWWRRLAEEDPAHEVAVLHLMQALAASGERGEALGWVDRHVHAVRVELEAEVDPGILALAESLRESPASEPGEGQAAVWRAPAVSVVWQPAPAARRGRGRGALPALAAVLLGLPLLAVALRTGNPPTDPRALVLPLENRSGDPSLDPLGDVAADRIILALSRSGVARVAPLEEGVRAAAEARSQGTVGGAGGSAAPDAGTPASRGGATTGADLRVEGALHVAGDSLRFQLTVTDLRRRTVVAAVGPTTAPREDPLPVLDDLARRTVVALALQGDSTPWTRALLAVQPPRIEAYREYVEGTRTSVRGDHLQAVERYAAAVALDSTFHAARLALAWSLGNVGRRAEGRSLAAALREVEHELAPLHRSSLDLLEAAGSGNPVRRYEAARRAAEAHGHWQHTLQWATEALRSMNRPREALGILQGMGRDGPHRETPQYWTYRARAHHVLAQHRHELGVAREARRANPEALWALELEAFALAALGRVDELNDVVRERLVRSRPGPEHPLEFVLYTALELHAHGQPAAAGRIIGRGVEWYRSLPPPQQADHGHLAYHALLLMHTHERTAAEALLHQVARAHPLEASLAGHIGVLAAERGDRDEARRIADRLGALEATGAFGDHPVFWQACVAAAMGETDEGVRLLREALRLGVVYHPRPHRLRCFDSLRSDIGFQELLRPRG